MNVTFSGIYDINFPQQTKADVLNEKYLQMKSLYDKAIGQNKANRGVHLLQDPSGKHSPIIRVVTPVDDPIFLLNLFGIVNEKLAKQYIEKTKVNLYA